MNKIEINKYGKIIRGEYENWLIYIQDDKENTGGYLILYMPAKDSKVGYDDWVENNECLKQYFLNSDMEMQWEED
jgi:hypothetical protein